MSRAIAKETCPNYISKKINNQTAKNLPNKQIQ